MPPGRLIGIGVFVAAGIFLFALGLFMIGERRLMFAEQFEVSAEFAEVSALQNGALVRVRGMHAGEVTAIAVPPSPSGKFKVRMRIREDLRQLVRTDSVASIQTDGIVGNRLRPGASWVRAGRGCRPRRRDRQPRALRVCRPAGARQRDHRERQHDHRATPGGPGQTAGHGGRHGTQYERHDQHSQR